ncbi:hypothetical protein B0T17DRAFT_483001 [Bombardia bombarda]|uniref:ZZ-type domain-containing protein n=1 Tax=Bombardia bombarda TaxID=252184 RepID=A0AA39XME7_9PEZI|nr:hypothetical protein B0T17DRAFT_483001 [Bombardia bombarda]
MASSSSTSPDTLVTIKVNLDGQSHRRFKLPLRDLGINVLEIKLRSILAIPAGADAVFERYSDSVTSYVVLDQKNPAVYKQLYRAAKAKQKLKLRVSVKAAEELLEEKTGSKPASVTDEVEEEASEIIESTGTSEEPELSAVSTSPSTVSLEERLPEPEATQTAMERSREALQASMAASMAHKPPMTRLTSSKSGGCPFSHLATSTMPNPHRANYAVCCNSCDQTIPEAHYHCSTCDDGDFDLCQDCVDRGITCYGANHWLIKRFVKDGVITNSTTERIAPKPKSKAQAEPTEKQAAPIAAAAERSERVVPMFTDFLYSSIRTCNCCVQELPEVEFVHCTTCEDFDLCRACFAKNRHGHHPKHGFAAAVEGTRLEPVVAHRLAPGRSQAHNAICDGCDKAILGIRHKCLDCPDWDYCSDCHKNAAFIHADHRFVPIYEPLEPFKNLASRAMSRSTHAGVSCDGPLCSTGRNSSTYIVGDRYKCAVCNDTDFCANCEASPANTHNRTHPLIKFKTPVRHVSVTTTGEHESGRQMRTMGDRRDGRPAVTGSRSTETPAQNSNSTNVVTVVGVQPSEPTPLAKVEEEVKLEEVEVKLEEVEEKPVVAEDLRAIFVRDSVDDGTVIAPNHIFEQTWVLRNEGNIAWPAGCSVKYVGGDYMGYVDPNHAAAVRDIVSCYESTICYLPLGPGEEFAFTVLLRTPQRSGRFVSNWRLTTKNGLKFGHRLWCDVVVETPKVTEPAPPVEETKEEEPVSAPVEEKKEEVETETQMATAPKPHESQMIFPKLEKESPVSSIHEAETKSQTSRSIEDEFEDCAEDDDWANSDDGFLTDEEYDVLDASDEEYLVGQQNKVKK